MRFWSIPLVVLFLVLALAACGDTGGEVGTPGTVVGVSAQPGAAPTEAMSVATATATPRLPSATPTRLPPSPSPTLQPVGDTPGPTLMPTSPTATAPGPTLMPTSPTATAPGPIATAAAEVVRDPATVEVGLQPTVDGLDLPVGISNAGDGSGRLFILEKVGRIRIVQDGVLQPSPFLDITDHVGASGSEQGLLGLAFHPNYASNGFLFVNYTDRQGNTVVSHFSVGADPARADPASERVLLTVSQPAANHNGGHLAFGPDGYLYIGLGDGGGAGDSYGNGQNGQTLLGALLRLDVDRSQPYVIPEDNPFAGDPKIRDEIWALGLRNPWRFSFDRVTGDLYIADVGQNLYEEINYQPAGTRGGENYGWPIMEGLHCFPADRACDQAGLTLPVQEYDHTQGCSVTGGYVYRGQEFPFLNGVYLFGDYCSGRIWGLAPGGDGPGQWQVAPVAQAAVRPTAFGEDEMGELYLVDAAGGELFKITARIR